MKPEPILVIDWVLVSVILLMMVAAYTFGRVDGYRHGYRKGLTYASSLMDETLKEARKQRLRQERDLPDPPGYRGTPDKTAF